jgi:hypothetical protein
MPLFLPYLETNENLISVIITNPMRDEKELFV